MNGNWPFLKGIYTPGNSRRLTTSTYFFLFLLTGTLVLLAYFTPRESTYALLAWYSLAFGAYGFLAFSHSKLSWKFWLGIGIFLRLLMLPGLPALSDDFYRFIWDGLMWHEGIHPFLHTPQELIETGKISKQGLYGLLYDNMNSPAYYTVYPPLTQAWFYLATAFSPEGILRPVLVLRGLMILAEVLSMILMANLLKKSGKTASTMAWYALNPLVILELTGNLHPEGLLIPMLLGGIYLFSYSKQKLSGLAWAGAIATKINPAMLMPLIWKRAGFYKGFIIMLISGLGVGLLLMPMGNPAVLSKIWASLDLYFRSFEFNASLYYILRAIGYQITGYNVIAWIGPGLAFAGGLGIILYSFMTRASLPKAITIIYLIYFLTATTVHPWYILPMVALAPLTGLRFPIAWSFLIFFTYSGYNLEGFEEILSLTFLEYGALIALIWYELKKT